MHLRLLVSRHDETHAIAILMQRLSNAGDIAVTKNAKTAGKEATADAITFDILIR
jgi:hypothetical protein